MYTQFRAGMSVSPSATLLTLQPVPTLQLHHHHHDAHTAHYAPRAVQRGANADEGRAKIEGLRSHSLQEPLLQLLGLNSGGNLKAQVLI